MHLCVHPCMSLWSSERVLAVFYCLLPWFVRQFLTKHWSWPFWQDCLDLLSLRVNTSLEVVWSHPVYGFWRFRLRSSCLGSKCACLLSHLPRFYSLFLKGIFQKSIKIRISSSCKQSLTLSISLDMSFMNMTKNSWVEIWIETEEIAEHIGKYFCATNNLSYYILKVKKNAISACFKIRVTFMKSVVTRCFIMFGSFL